MSKLGVLPAAAFIPLAAIQFKAKYGHWNN
jgi:hypothetical protein